MSRISSDGVHAHSAHTLSARNLGLGYGGHTVIDDLDVDIPHHQIGAIIGPNGCGKSTLLKAFARLLRPSRGEVSLDGRPLSSYSTRHIATTIGILPQSPQAPEGIAIGDLVARGRHPYHGFAGGWTREDDRAVAHALTVTGLADLADRPLDEVSGGQRQRAWIALTLAQETDILLLDEPTTYLDIAYQLDVLDLLADLNRQEGVTIVMVLHDLNMAARYSDWILAMKDGERKAYGAPRDVITEEIVREVFAVEARVSMDVSCEVPVMSPASSHSLLARRRRDAPSNR
ncbi:MAG: ABC transporter ATP-binding protein [Bifidobacterium sp.]|nr:ABC transporter ATP-binding protein [Bifidobacterium sp.]